ncbi:neurogenic locus notch homolog protein 1-like isoform X1 [Corticium candelabrum]|uniref:neurogenic locus notch homolog protein 1-like isoform X1 n=1 Tax=Corticium candelabrum TaxID=121492 RepID=UPI002E275465|nr:neurogenic locus notch homolog protein 1-like isoform X1 [Corticium candelabrum]
MSRHSFSFLLLASLLGVISALSLFPTRCKELFRDCNKEALCGVRSCTVVERCCTSGWGYNRCYTNSRKERECAPFQCENGGKRLPLRGKREISYGGCEIPTPQCACPQGFGGQCCEELIDPCTYTKCGAGQICKSVKVVCKKAPCPLQAICVSDVGICPLFPNTITTCEIKPFSCGNDSHCSDGQLCCKRGCGRECIKSLPSGTTGCARVVCRPGTVCRESSVGVLCPVLGPCEKRVECVPEVVEPTDTTTTTSVVEATVAEPTNRPGTCPRYTKIGKPPCEKNCSDDADCKGKQKCCEKHCSRVCVDPLFKVENPCARVDCKPGHVCVPNICFSPPCKKFRCIPQLVPAPCPLVACPKGQICKKVPIPCVIPPCPEQYRCVPSIVLHSEVDVDPCARIRCAAGTSCQVQKGRAECVRPGTCPKFPGLVTTCQIGLGYCRSDIECRVGEKCCRRGCGPECVRVDKFILSPCAIILCPKGTICVERKGKGICKFTDNN